MPSMMMIDTRNVPEPYCERCAKTYPAVAAVSAEKLEMMVSAMRLVSV